MPTNYDEMTVVELKELAGKRGTPLPHNATKDEIIDCLQNKPKPAMKDDEPKTEKAATKEDKRPFKMDGHIRIIGHQSDDTRLFQTSPDCKEWLTEGEATGKGFYWANEYEAGKINRLFPAPAVEKR